MCISAKLYRDIFSYWQNIKSYLLKEQEEHKRRDITFHNWTTVTLKDIPRQDNGYDGGIYCCKYADWLSDDLCPAFEPGQMLYFRKRLMCEIVRGATLN